ncbi:UNVERIFIED_CONTAM: hypothetical protein GTU68_062760 [Idotea baltica]|nr:hypothetical protein [Idotea baltica]
MYLPAIFSLVLLLAGLAVEHVFHLDFFQGPIKLCWYILAYIPVGLPVLKHAWKSLTRGEVFTEFFLMSVATLGAFAIGEYPEGVAVMLFYSIGELFQGAAVRRAKQNIKSLLDLRPRSATVRRQGQFSNVTPESVIIGETIQVRVGEKIPLDGKLLSDKAQLNTAALTGESKPQIVTKDAQVYAGSVNLESVIEVEVEKLFSDSSVARILELVQDATSRKAKTELLIRRLAKIYTPLVVYLAIAICILPYFFVADYHFYDWLYRALIFLVISCPCALVISIPLGYFGGLGAASKNGILFKGATYLDQITEVNTVVMDKTGTVTKGVFSINDISHSKVLEEGEFMKYVLAIEKKSTHPIAKALLKYDASLSIPDATSIEEIAGQGLKGTVREKSVLVGNKKLLMSSNISVPVVVDDIIETIVLVAIDEKYTGYITISDELKDDAVTTIRSLKAQGIEQIVMLSGDKDSITQKVGRELGIDRSAGGLMPEDKLLAVEKIMEDPSKTVAFIGDGINDAPVLATSQVGVAMGGLGSDVAIETADVIIQTDQPSKIVTGIKIGNATKKIIWQNIILAFGVKVLVLLLGAVGLATMWAAVFADVGVALLAIINAVRLQRMEFA